MLSGLGNPSALQKLCAEWGSTNTSWHIDVHYVSIFMHTQSVKLKHSGIWGWGIHGLDGWGIYGIHGGNIVDGRLLGVGHSWSSHDHGFGPFEPPTRGLLQKGREYCRWPLFGGVRRLGFHCIYSLVIPHESGEDLHGST